MTFRGRRDDTGYDSVRRSPKHSKSVFREKTRSNYRFSDIHFRGVMFHSLTDRSLLPEARVLPSGLKLTQLTVCSFPSSLAVSWPVFAFQRRTVQCDARRLRIGRECGCEECTGDGQHRNRTDHRWTSWRFGTGARSFNEGSRTQYREMVYCWRLSLWAQSTWRID